MGIKVAELNTLSDAKGITGIRFLMRWKIIIIIIIIIMAETAVV